MREPPPVTLHAPGAPGPEPGPRRRRRWPLLLVPPALVALLVVDQRGREPAALVDLVALPGSSGSSNPGVAQARVDVRLRLRNDGPRPVVVERAALGPYALARPVELRAGATGTLLLTREVRCTSEPPPPLTAEVLDLTVSTARGDRAVAVPLAEPVGEDGAARACGFLPLEEAVTPLVLFAQSEPTRVLLTVELQVGGVQPVAVTGVRGGRLVVDGPLDAVQPLELPFPLPPVDPQGPLVRSLQVGLLLEACPGPVPPAVQLELSGTSVVEVDVSAYAEALADPPC